MDDNDLISLEAIKMAMICKAVEGNFLQALRRFFDRMTLSWSNTKTARAFMRGNTPMIELGREFFREHVHSPGDGAEVVLHEILHHLFGHLLKELHHCGFSAHIVNVAMDAIINAYLASVNCAGFMARFYPDEEYYAYLRPGSKNLPISRSDIAWQEARAWQPDSNVPQPPHPSTFKSKHEFYSELYELRITLEQSLDFFRDNIPDQPGVLPFMGDHDGLRGTRESVFDSAAAQTALRDLLPGKVKPHAHNNFAKIIAQITSTAKSLGGLQSGKRLSYRMPAKLAMADTLRFERGSNLFQRSIFEQKQFALCIDTSGSVRRYIPFALALATSMQNDQMDARCYCWAGKVAAVSLEQLKAGALPDVDAHLTECEEVATFLERNPDIAQAIIITDNKAGELLTRIRIPVHLCLLPFAQMTGSFLNKRMVPDCKVHHLVA